MDELGYDSPWFKNALKREMEKTGFCLQRNDSTFDEEWKKLSGLLDPYFYLGGNFEKSLIAMVKKAGFSC